MKKVAAVVFSVLVVSLIACGGSADPGSSGEEGAPAAEDTANVSQEVTSCIALNTSCVPATDTCCWIYSLCHHQPVCKFGGPGGKYRNTCVC